MEDRLDAPIEEAATEPRRRGRIPALLTRNNEERLSFEPTGRILLGVVNAGVLGLLLGFNRSFGAAALRFRAENAHRLPKSQKGWYYYHRSKNYTALKTAVLQAPALGGRLGFWTGLFLVSEQSWDDFREKRGTESKDVFSTLAAGFMVSGVYSIWSK
jgi:hypothetical protein